MRIIRIIKMTKEEHKIIKNFLNIVQADEELESYSFSEIFDDIMAGDNSHRKVFNIEYTDEE